MLQSSVRENLGDFQDQFTENQKKAIMCSLFLIANSDGEFHHKEQQFFEQTAMLLGYTLTSDILDEFLSMERTQLFQLLGSLKEDQKDWYIITAYGMVHADGQTLEVEFQYLDVFFTKMGITVERFQNVLKKSQLLMNKFLK